MNDHNRMSNELTVRPVARIRTDFPTKFGIPRQAGLAEALEGTVVFEPDYRIDEALRGLEGFSHLWLIWGFSENADHDWTPTVRPPRLGGNMRMGVFATRSPFRPNGLGLSCVRLLSVQKEPGLGTTLRVAGADMVDGTPIYDIKPYLPYADSVPDAVGGFAPDAGRLLELDFPPELEEKVPPEKRLALRAVLAHDPRPRYQEDPDRVYGMGFAGLEVCFQVRDGLLRVVDVGPGAD
jgi:tRNA-Thr(GGU) m(6)t(6)A37 methyltransferase TsaA